MEKSEFLMDTLGHCVICLDQVTTSGSDAETKVLLDMDGVTSQPFLAESSRKELSRIRSFHGICKYLKTNVKDLMSDAPPMSPTLFEPLTTSSELKGTLCCDCAPLLDRFSNYYLELEEIRMKVKHSLQPILAKLAPGMDEDDQNQTLGDFKEEMMRWPKTSAQYGIVERWRRKTFEGCSRILNDIQPRVEVAKLTEEDFQFNMAKRRQAMSSPPSQISHNSEDSGAVIKVEPTGDEELPAVKIEEVDDANSDDVDPLDEDYNLPHSSAGFTSAESESETEEMVQHIVRKSKGVKSIKSFADSKKHKCSQCNKILANPKALKIHYRSAHLKLKHCCPDCGREFLHRTSLNRHRRSIHEGFRYNCDDCGKSFIQSKGLNNHRKKGTCATPNVPEPEPFTKEADLERTDFILPDAPPESTGVQRRSKESYLVIFQDSGDLPDPMVLTDDVTGLHICSVCSKHYFSLKLAQDHFNSAHRTKKFQCRLCSKVLNSKVSFYNHRAGVHGPRNFECDVCHKSFRYIAGLRRHRLSTSCAAQETSFRYKCSSCSKEFYNRDACYRHRQRDHGKGARFKCHDCQDVFKLEKGLRQHRQTVHRQRKWKCSTCPRVFYNSESKKLHQRLHCRVRKLPGQKGVMSPAAKSTLWIKTEPNLEMGDNDKLKLNDQGQGSGSTAKPKATAKGKLPPIVINSKTGNVICPLCPKEYSERNSFKKHYKTAHLKLRVLCPECGEQFTRQGGLDIHMKNFHMGVKFLCTVCAQGFSQKSGLTRHLRRSACGKVKVMDSKMASAKEETVPRPSTTSTTPAKGRKSTFNSKLGRHVCSICKLDFSSKDSFQAHYRNIHLQQRHSCPTCNKEFTCRQSYARHVREVHKGLTTSSYTCDFCNNKFSTKSYLNKHKKNCKGGPRPIKPPLKYVCSHPGCTKEFYRSNNMQRHLETVHAKDKDKSQKKKMN